MDSALVIDIETNGLKKEITFVETFDYKSFAKSFEEIQYEETVKQNISNIKIPLIKQNVNCMEPNRGCAEIQNGETVSIEAYNGDFKVNIYNYNAPKYIPYI